MLKKLRWKSVLVNMIIVTVMLGIVFSLLYYSTCRSLERESFRMMRIIAQEPRRNAPPDLLQEAVRLPYFSVMVDRTGEILETGGGFFDLSDETYLEALLLDTFKEKPESGVLKSYQLRYLKTEAPFGLCIVYADMSSERSVLRNLVRSFLLLGGATFLLFFGISVILARWTTKPVEKAWQQQKQFVADASHELKTPLTVILTDAELLNSGSCSEEERFRLSGGMISMAGQMRGLVENLLEMARIDAGTVTGTRQNVSLSDVVTETAMTFEPVFFEKGQPFSEKVEPELYVFGNDQELRRLTAILLDNASKYASPGGETVLRLYRSGHRHCVLEVADRGEPIPKEELEKLFFRFYRADSARAMNHSYGLGLSIAAGIVEFHGGRIRAESREGFNVFLAELPLVTVRRTPVSGKTDI